MNVSTEALLLLLQVTASRVRPLYWPRREFQLTLPPAGDLAANKEAARCQRGPPLFLLKKRGRGEMSGERERGGPKQLCSAVTSQINRGKRFVPVCAGTRGWSLGSSWHWEGFFSIILSSLLSHANNNEVKSCCGSANKTKKKETHVCLWFVAHHCRLLPLGSLKG